MLFRSLENNLDVTKIKGTGNFGRVLPDDVLIAAGKKSPVVAVAVAVTVAPVSAAVSIATTTSPIATTNVIKVSKETVLDGIVPMDGMQKAVAKNMEKTMNVPIFRVSR